MLFLVQLRQAFGAALRPGERRPVEHDESKRIEECGEAECCQAAANVVGLGHIATQPQPQSRATTVVILRGSANETKSPLSKRHRSTGLGCTFSKILCSVIPCGHAIPR